MRQFFVFLKPKPANKKTPDLDRSGETVTVTMTIALLQTINQKNL